MSGSLAQAALSLRTQAGGFANGRSATSSRQAGGRGVGWKTPSWRTRQTRAPPSCPSLCTSPSRGVRAREASGRRSRPSHVEPHHGIALSLNPSLCSTPVLRPATPPSSLGPGLCVIFDFLFPLLLNLRSIPEGLPLRVFLLLLLTLSRPLPPAPSSSSPGTVMATACCSHSQKVQLYHESTSRCLA